MWGEFAANAKASGNTVVMVSRRPDTEADRSEVTATLGDFAAAFDSVLLVGEQMKADAAKAAGLAVDIWVDDSPQFIAKAEGEADGV